MTVELTEADKKNGWTQAALEKYHKEREEVTSRKILDPKKVKPAAQRGYNPLKWRE